jgi:hypothetical protein
MRGRSGRKRGRKKGRMRGRKRYNWLYCQFSQNFKAITIANGFGDCPAGERRILLFPTILIGSIHTTQCMYMLYSTVYATVSSFSISDGNREACNGQ